MQRKRMKSQLKWEIWEIGEAAATGTPDRKGLHS